MQNKCRWGQLALSDLINIQEFIARDNPRASVDITKKIVLIIVEELCQFQNMGRAGRISGTRELIIPGTPYIAIYRVKAGQIEILRVLHSSMKWPDQLKDV